jgi:hypothetical protein
LTRVFGVTDYASSSDVGATGQETCAYVDFDCAGLHQGGQLTSP